MKNLIQKMMDQLGARPASILLVWGLGILLIMLASLVNLLDPAYDRLNSDPLYIGDALALTGFIIFIGGVLILLIRSR